MVVIERLRCLSNFVFAKIAVLNLFNTKSTDAETIRREIYSTRLFIILLSLSVVIITLYTALSIHVKTETLTKPTHTHYQQLYALYPDSLQCPCTQISILYNEFIRVTSSFHQVCSSKFVSQPWIDFVFATNLTFIWIMDVRTSMSAMWQLIFALCQYANTTFSDTLGTFSNTPLISSMLIEENLLRTQIQASVDLTRQTASDNLLRSFTAVRQITQASGFLTGVSTNFIVPLSSSGWDSTFNTVLFSQQTRYIQSGSTTICYCQSDRSCSNPGNLYLYKSWETYGLFNLTKLIANTTLPGLVVDCLPIQMTLSSSLECFYNQTCLNTLISAYSRDINISILDKSLSSRFTPQTNIEQLVGELFIEEVINEITFKSYYDRCKPSYCTYTVARRFDILFIITSIIGLVGGLNVALRLLSPYIINFILRFKQKPTIQPEQTENLTMKIRLQNLINTVKLCIIQVNIFNSHSHDLNRTNKERISTRFYIILIIISISILIFYTLLSVQTINQTIELPSQEQYEMLQELYPNTLKCPCTNIKIPYGNLFQIIPRYHQLCTSDFIQPWFYKTLNLISNVGLNTFFDFRLVASSYFQMLSIFCELANLTFVHANRGFSSTIYINNQVLPRNLFHSQGNALMNTFLNFIPIEFQYTLSMINTILQSNQYLSSTQTNVVLNTLDFSRFGFTSTNPLQIMTQSVIFHPEENTTCNCARHLSCVVPVERIGNLSVTGLYMGCFVMDMALKSSLVCWYNQTCVTALNRYYLDGSVNIPNNITILDSTITSRFLPTTSFEALLQEVLVEQWNTSSSYENFYQKCRPAYCKYTYQERSNAIYIVTTIIALFGGLNVILRLISPFVANTFSTFTNKFQKNPQIYESNDHSTADIQEHPKNTRQVSFLTEIHNKLIKLNLFKSDSTEIHIIQHEQSTSRLYLVLLSSLILIHIISNIILKETTSKIVSTPTQTQYEELYALYTDTLQCPCADLSLPYKGFVEIDADFHQICVSDFVTDVWLDYLYGIGFWGFQIKSDLRGRGAAYFGLISSLCKLSKTTINNARDKFLEEILVNDQIISEKEFSSRMNLIISRFQVNTPYKFSCSLQLLRDITHGNAFMSSYLLNWEYVVRDNRSNATVSIVPISPNNLCSCGKRSDCSAPGGIYQIFTNRLLLSLSGLNVGCSAVETVLRSTLQILYNQTTINQIQQYGTDRTLYPPLARDIKVMNSTYPSRFLLNTSFIDIVDQLFVEQWKINLSYTSFYQQCAPMYCSYTFDERHDTIYVFTRLLAIYGGLTTVLRLITPYIISIIFSITNRCRNNQISVDA